MNRFYDQNFTFFSQYFFSDKKKVVRSTRRITLCAFLVAETMRASLTVVKLRQCVCQNEWMRLLNI